MIVTHFADHTHDDTRSENFVYMLIHAHDYEYMLIFEDCPSDLLGIFTSLEKLKQKLAELHPNLPDKFDAKMKIAAPEDNRVCFDIEDPESTDDFEVFEVLRVKPDILFPKGEVCIYAQ